MMLQSITLLLICSHSAEDISVLCDTVHEMDKGVIEGVRSVSYTHLDVYKRQEYHLVRSWKPKLVILVIFKPTYKIFPLLFRQFCHLINAV